MYPRRLWPAFALPGVVWLSRQSMDKYGVSRFNICKFKLTARRL